MDLFEHVLHAIEGEEIKRDGGLSATGETIEIEHRSFGPDRWILRAKTGRLDAINFLAIILFATEGACDNEERRRIVEHWGEDLRAAADSGEITARDPVTLLPLKARPVNCGWVIAEDDAEKYIKSRGMGWAVADVIEHLAAECHGAVTREYFSKHWSGASLPYKSPEKPVPEVTPDDWRVSARAIADECFKSDTRNHCRDSLAGYSLRVMNMMQEREIHGPRGRHDNPRTIQREALQGSLWWTQKKK